MRHAATVIFLIASTTVVSAQAPPQYVKDAAAAYRSKNFPECARIFAAATRTEPGHPPGPAFGASRCHAATGELALASHYLDLALTRGFRQCGLLASDTALAPLHPLQDWPRFVARCESTEKRFYEGLNAEVFAAFLGDQSDRAADEADPNAIMGRDAARRRIVQLALASHSLRTADDYFYAGMIMQHGSTVEEIALARDLSKRAGELDRSQGQALWLYAASTDRLLWRTGHPQIYGTQYKKVDGKWTLEPFDRSAVTDRERARLHVDSMAERSRFIEEINKPDPSQP
jgi:hypothetical protein